MNATVLRRLVHTELLLALREPVSMFMSVILPLAVFLALGFSVGSMEIEVDMDSGIVELFHVRASCSPGTSPGLRRYSASSPCRRRWWSFASMGYSGVTGVRQCRLICSSSRRWRSARQSSWCLWL